MVVLELAQVLGVRAHAFGRPRAGPRSLSRSSQIQRLSRALVVLLMPSNKASSAGSKACVAELPCEKFFYDKVVRSRTRVNVVQKSCPSWCSHPTIHSMKNLSSAAVAAFVLTAAANLAFAQGEEDPLSSEPASEEWSSDSSSSSSASSDSAPASSDGGSVADRTMGFSTSFPTGGDLGAANVLYGLDADTFLDIRFGFNFSKGEVSTNDPMDPTATTSETSVGLFAGAGYRMYKPTKGKIRPYLEPGAFISIANFSEAGDTLALGLNAVMGVDYALMDQFTLGMAVGGALNFSDSFETISLGLLTQSINATFWW